MSFYARLEKTWQIFWQNGKTFVLFFPDWKTIEIFLHLRKVLCCLIGNTFLMFFSSQIVKKNSNVFILFSKPLQKNCPIWLEKKSFEIFCSFRPEKHLKWLFSDLILSLSALLLKQKLLFMCTKWRIPLLFVANSWTHGHWLADL